MPSEEKTDTARPQKLHTVSDSQKATAITAAYEVACGQSPVTRIEMVDYNGRMGSRGPFRLYSEIKLSLFAEGDANSANELIDSLQQVADDQLATEMAGNLGKLTGETYQVHIASKRFRRSQTAGREIGQLRLQLACP